LEYHPTAFRLDWMHEGEMDFEDSSRFDALAQELKPDLLHLISLVMGAWRLMFRDLWLRTEI